MVARVTTDGPTPEPAVWVDPLPELDEPDELDDEPDPSGQTDPPLAQDAHE